MKKFFFVVFWGCFESYSMNADLVNNAKDTGGSRSVESLDDLPEHMYCVRMNLFHEMYGLFCSQRLGGMISMMI
jgi:hypothetical protein